MLKNTSSSYGFITKLFHWLVGITIIAMLIVGFFMTDMSPSDEKWQVYSIHKATGVIVLSLVLMRVLWRFINVQPELPIGPLWQKLASKATHFLLYIFMFLMPISGVLMSRFGGREIDVFGLFIIPPLEKDANLASLFHDLHGVFAIMFSLLIGLHFCAGLYHHFILKDNVLIRMINK